MDKYDIKNAKYVHFKDGVNEYGFYLGDAKITKEGKLCLGDDVVERIVYNNLLELNQIDGSVEIVCSQNILYSVAEWTRVYEVLKNQLVDSKKVNSVLLRYFTGSAHKTSINNKIVDLSSDEIDRFYGGKSDCNERFNVFCYVNEDKTVRKGMLIIKPEGSVNILQMNDQHISDNNFKSEDKNGLDDRFDICTFIRSYAIRKHIAQNDNFDNIEKAYIILNSFFPLEDKISALTRLSDASDDENGNIISKICQLLNAAWAKGPFVKSENYLYCVNRNGTRMVNCYSVKENECHSPEYYYSSEQFLKDYADIEYDEDDTVPYYVVDVIPLTDKGYKIAPIVSLYMSYFENGFKIFYVEVNKEWAIDEGFDEKVIDITNGDYGMLLGRYSLPFVNGEEVMIKTPFMEDPLYGVIESKLDGNGCRYHFLKLYGLPEVDLSYYTINFLKGISVFDWLYPSDGLEYSEVRIQM